MITTHTFLVICLQVYNTDRMVPDSAGTGTAYLTGVKTRFGIVGVDTLAEFANCDSQKGRELTSILDWAVAEGILLKSLYMKETRHYIILTYYIR